MPVNKRGRIFFSAADFYATLDILPWKRVVNTEYLCTLKGEDENYFIKTI